MSWWVARKEDGSGSVGRGTDGATGANWFGSREGSCSEEEIQGRTGQAEGEASGKGR